MEPTLPMLHTEIRKIAHLQGLKISRYYLLISMAVGFPCFFSQRSYCTYIFFFALLAPALLSNIPKKKTDSAASVLATLKKEYAYSNLHYYCLLITFWLTNFLLIIWQVCNQSRSFSSSFAKQFPLLVLVGNLICYVFVSYYYQFKLHYQLKNNRW